VGQDVAIEVKPLELSASAQRHAAGRIRDLVLHGDFART